MRRLKLEEVVICWGSQSKFKAKPETWKLHCLTWSSAHFSFGAEQRRQGSHHTPARSVWGACFQRFGSWLVLGWLLSKLAWDRTGVEVAHRTRGTSRGVGPWDKEGNAANIGCADGWAHHGQARLLSAGECARGGPVQGWGARLFVYQLLRHCFSWRPYS